MSPISYFTNLICSSCNKSFDPDQVQTYCSECGAPLMAEYDISGIKNAIDRDSFTHRAKGMWRWHELLPIRDSGNVITLGEGDTPLLKLNNIGREIGISNLYIKDESFNPTGSFKARGLSCAVSKAHEHGIRKFVIP